jgi:hypothetical protein
VNKTDPHPQQIGLFCPHNSNTRKLPGKIGRRRLQSLKSRKKKKNTYIPHQSEVSLSTTDSLSSIFTKVDLLALSCYLALLIHLTLPALRPLRQSEQPLTKEAGWKRTLCCSYSSAQGKGFSLIVQLFFINLHDPKN